jgi:hypothetical protein
VSASSKTVSAELHAGQCFLTIVFELFGNSSSGVSYTGQKISLLQFLLHTLSQLFTSF